MKENKSSHGLGFVGALTVAFVVLKLCDEINWSWWWVLSPLWISFGIILLIAIIWAIFDRED